jgi:hypothetical protein
MLVLLMGGIYTQIEMPLYGMTVLQTFKKIGADVQAILKFCLRKLSGSNVGIMKCTAGTGSDTMICT